MSYKFFVAVLFLSLTACQSVMTSTPPFYCDPAFAECNAVVAREINQSIGGSAGY